MSLSEIRSRLLQIGAEINRCEHFLSVYAEDHPKRTPKRILTKAIEQQIQLTRWASEIASIARKLEEVDTSKY